MRNRFPHGRRATIAIVAVLAVLTTGALTLTANGEEMKASDNPVVVMETSMGPITMELYPDKAPITVENFLWYVDNKFYDGLVFHRVIGNFMIQGGGMTKDLVRKHADRKPIKNEANNGLSNEKYTVAMARTGEINSATSQFFINVKDNKPLDYKGPSPQEFGYCVFGKVIDGTETVDKIKDVPTTTKGQYADVPKTPVMIEKVYRMEKKMGEKTES